MIINNIPGKGNEAAVSSGDVIKSSDRIRTVDMINTLNDTNQNAALLTTDLLKITKEMINGKGTMGQLINDMFIAKDLKQTIVYLNNTSKNTAESMA